MSNLPNSDVHSIPLRSKRMQRLYAWAAGKAYSRFAPLWIGVVFLLELVLFIPLDAILMLFCWENPKRRFLYASVAALASTVCAAIGYCMGHFLWDAISPFALKYLISSDTFSHLCTQYQIHEHFAVWFGSLLPLPFKAVTLTAGACHLTFSTFLAMVLLARSLRFFAIAQAMHLWGAQFKSFVERHLGKVFLALGFKIGIVFLLFWLLGHA